MMTRNRNNNNKHRNHLQGGTDPGKCISTTPKSISSTRLPGASRSGSGDGLMSSDDSLPLFSLSFLS